MILTVVFCYLCVFDQTEECRKCNKKTGPAPQLIWITDTPESGCSEEPTMIRDTPDLREAVKNIGP